MGIQLMEIYPKVVAADRPQTLHFRLEGSDLTQGTPEVKVMPMESYAVSHYPDYRSHQDDRYEWMPLTEGAQEVYTATADFAREQRYSVQLRMGDTVFYTGHLYAVAPDLASLRPYKGDTHLHTNCSDGHHTPVETVCNYRAAGYDFISITDHGRYYPSVDTQSWLGTLTDQFYILPGEEVHPKGGSYFHIISLGAQRSTSAVLEQEKDYVEAQVAAVLARRPDLQTLPDPYAAAFRIVVVQEIHRAGGLAVMAHPFWDTGGEYNYQTEEFLYHWRHGDFDALELLAGNDDTGNGNNLQELLWHDLRAEGLRVPIVGSSDAHAAAVWGDYDHFSRQFALFFATGYEDLVQAIRDRRTVAVDRRDDKHYRCIGDYRYAKYARFLMAEYYPPFTALCAAHARALMAEDAAALTAVEAEITVFKRRFFGV